MNTTVTHPTADEMIEKAAKHFTAWCVRNGYRVELPSRDASEVRGCNIHLRNVRGELATYVFDPYSNRARPRSFWGFDRTPDGRRIH
ncbi:MAG: hypothetical protein QM820_47035 [Minicystis sp.]